MEKHIDSVTLQELDKKQKLDVIETNWMDELWNKEKQRLEQDEIKWKMGL